MKEYERTCLKCHAVWHFSEQDVEMEKIKNGKNMVRGLFGMVGHIAGQMPLDQVEDLKRCNKCGSREVTIVEAVSERDKMLMQKQEEEKRKRELEAFRKNLRARSPVRKGRYLP